MTSEQDCSSLLISGFLRQYKHYTKLKKIKIKDLIELFYLIPIDNSAIQEPMIICNDNVLILPTKNLQPSILLINGYIRKQHLIIVPEINNLIYSFYQKMSGKSFVWKINNIDQLLNYYAQYVNSTKSIDSNVYSIKASFQELIPAQQFLNNSSFKFYFKLHPNGTYGNIGKCQIYIVLVSMPSLMDEIHFLYQLFCPELNIYWYSSKHKYRNDTILSLTNDTNSSISLTLLQSLHLKSLTFYCSFDITKIYINSEYKYNLPYYYDLKQ
eukprot:21369_1